MSAADPPTRTAANGGVPRRPRSLFLDWRAILGIAISATLLYFAFRGENFGDVAREIAGADPLLFVLATAAATFVFWIRAWRWKSLLAPVIDSTTFRSRFAAVCIGFMGNNLLPARIGEFARAFALARMEPVSVVASFSTLVIERLFDGIALVAILFLTTMLPDFPSAAFRADSGFAIAARTLGIFVVAGIVVLFLLVLWPARTVRILERIVDRVLPGRLRRPVVDALEAFLAGASILRDVRLLARAGSWTVVLWLFNAFSFWLGLRAFGLDLPFTAALFLQSVVALAVSVPSSPGFFGPFELATRAVLVDFWGQNVTQAVGFALGFHLAGFIPVTAIGLWYAWRLGLSLRGVAGSEEEVEEAVEEAVERESHSGDGSAAL
jgi:hypothetical protein